MTKLLLTQAIVDTLRCEPQKKSTEFCDLQIRGLLVYCTSSPTHIPKYQVRGKNEAGTNRLSTLGSIRELRLSNARVLALQLKQEWATKAKAVSAIALVATKTELTWDTYIADHFAPHAAATIRSAKKYDQLHRIYVSPRFGHLPLSQITRRAAQAMHTELLTQRKVSPATADHVIKYMRRALNKAVEWSYLDTNPIRRFELAMVANEIENYLDDEQMQRLLEVLRTDKNRPVCLILMMLISTGARLNEILTASWKNVTGNTLKVDAIRSKSKRSRSIPLNDSAMWVLDQLESKGKSDYLFPSPVFAKDGKDLPFTNITRARVRLFKLAGVSIRAHDLRHGFASMLVSNGRSLYEVQQILGHSDPKITMRYAHLSSKTLQEAANAGSVIVPKQQTQPPTNAANMASADLPVSLPQAA